MARATGGEHALADFDEEISRRAHGEDAFTYRSARRPTRPSVPNLPDFLLDPPIERDASAYGRPSARLRVDGQLAVDELQPLPHARQTESTRSRRPVVEAGARIDNRKFDLSRSPPRQDRRQARAKQQAAAVDDPTPDFNTGTKNNRLDYLFYRNASVTKLSTDSAHITTYFPVGCDPNTNCWSDHRMMTAIVSVAP
jgi:hypothetical protein